MNCEFCSLEMKIRFGSGRFCGKSCASAFAQKLRKERKGTTDTKNMSVLRAKNFLLAVRGHRCEICLLETWQGQFIPLELDHIDGNSDNSEEKNLRLICPNCHSQTPTHAGKNARKHPNTQRHKLYRRLYNGSAVKSGT